MASIRPCNKCGERISIRQMPHGQWVAFDVATDDQHKCSKKKSKKIQKKSTSKKLSKETDYGGLSLEESNYNLNDYDDSIEQNDYHSDEEKIRRLKNIGSEEKVEYEKNEFNPLFIAVIVIIVLAIALS